MFIFSHFADGKEGIKPNLSDRSKYGSIVQLSPRRANTSWWKKRNDRIFRKKTLFMRVPILQWLPKYSTNDFLADIIAGVTIGITVIPQALAYATIGGLPPEVYETNSILRNLFEMLLFLFLVWPVFCLCGLFCLRSFRKYASCHNWTYSSFRLLLN